MMNFVVSISYSLSTKQREDILLTDWRTFESENKIHVHDWRTYIPMELRGAWTELTWGEKLLLWFIAERIAEQEKWD